ncbi:uncharacterized protein K460DRAFT_333952 [Cucurbitaria berberidis CBS 394.84]|uniref:Zn(2)-C6 fungal-type domain-containing protein n=1 Tax=Cucurbitaria berberidis CBS 394.84 TaxID=1168544 RepID=A0A9P4GN03_9PLEO|nr:uncharacterized protein K460DRAFT_333952 [Cucurbitaria berberidis CBS 394.84]KAF1848184.1 hypothetical protein K460DRAFT_333952 [Cucurbitaria berberidis CBS 394.84]
MRYPSFEREGESPPRLKKRKIRRGTKSCWECKRRKVRCTFVASTETSCDGCKSRQTLCIGQEMDYLEREVDDSKAGSLNLEEALVEQLAKQAKTNSPGLVTHQPQNAKVPKMCSISNNSRHAATASPDLLTPSTRPNLDLLYHANSSHDELCGALLAAWPTQRELDLMTSITVGTPMLFHGTVCLPYSSLLSNDTASPREMLQLPPPGSHPVLLARKLLLLGSFLQGIPPESGKFLSETCPNYREVMSHMVETSSRLVTSNDDLVASIEGIECIMIESMYRNNGGKLRQAWLTNRRAMGMAQMIGLPLGKLPSPTLLDVQTRERVNPEYMWTRLVMSDRYLSLTLGLPQGSQESPFATPQALKGCAPMDRMERIEAAVGGLIIQRNSQDLLNLKATHEIDKQLQDAAASMPAKWWLFPNVASLSGFDANAFSETFRIMTQFTHFHLLVQLHLPYLLQSSGDRKYDYSKITAVNASREILSRFVAFRGLDIIAAYCRGVDFIVFIASTTLCLAHIDASRQLRNSLDNAISALSFLAHQRLGDRGLLERILQIMEEMTRTDSDPIASRIASMLQRLLDIEVAAANGDSYNASMSFDLGDQAVSKGDNTTEDGDKMSITISVPSLGNIRIESQARAIATDKDFLALMEDPFDVQSLLFPEPIAGTADWALQGVDYAFFDTLNHGTENSLTTREELGMW